ncbi:hypothetical protein [Methylobacterium brachiatum]
MEIASQFAIGMTTSFAVLSPGIFIAIREAVKRQRQEIITDLATVFDSGEEHKLNLIPSFEFVKYKYFVGSRRKTDPEFGVADGSRKSAGPFDPHRKREDYSTISWLISSSAFSTVAGIGVFYIISLLIYLMSPQSTNQSAFTWADVTYPKIDSLSMIWLLAMCAAFAGSYLMALRSLYRAIKNFDLSPGTIVSETIKVLISIVLAPVIAISILILGTEIVHTFANVGAPRLDSFGTAAVITACFVAGIMPDVALRLLIQRDQLKNFKQEENAIFQAFKITPVEIIDGIDSDIRARLEDHHIHSTQNLAAANPLMLFVETPYGVYQIMDWVAQAQLCCSVGRDKIIRLWPLGVRTLFDLERLADKSDASNQALLLEVGRIILGSTLIPTDVKDPAAAAALVKTSIELRLDDPHVQRLRQIYIAVGDRLGSKSRRFRGSRYRVLCRNRTRRGWSCKGFRSQHA